MTNRRLKIATATASASASKPVLCNVRAKEQCQDRAGKQTSPKMNNRAHCFRFFSAAGCVDYGEGICVGRFGEGKQFCAISQCDYVTGIPCEESAKV